MRTSNLIERQVDKTVLSIRVVKKGHPFFYQQQTSAAGMGDPFQESLRSNIFTPIPIMDSSALSDRDGEYSSAPEEPPIKKQKVYSGGGDDDAETSAAAAAKASGWDPAWERFLKDTINNELALDKTKKIPWKKVYNEFITAFPGSNKTLKACTRRWDVYLKNAVEDMTGEEMEYFKRAVDDVDGAERMAAYAWRYETLTGKKMNKKSAARIFKKLNMKKTW